MFIFALNEGPWQRDCVMSWDFHWVEFCNWLHWWYGASWRVNTKEYVNTLPYPIGDLLLPISLLLLSPEILWWRDTRKIFVKFVLERRLFIVGATRMRVSRASAVSSSDCPTPIIKATSIFLHVYRLTVEVMQVSKILVHHTWHLVWSAAA